ncbi:hypothetical protein EXN66_Car008043 [Channa argus]|uniref:LRAT domain-containing protein n=1 Tax=Channa argus TaxID=215402 RepID=A0A6G1PQ73_CHAAH|nr:hypothetical protein EXN66_Car008043 [Channa argus]
MRSLIVVAVILHLVIGDYEFGDIIAFETVCPCTPTILYEHYAIYVGGGKIPEAVDNDIFHRTNFAGTNCNFDKLANHHRNHHVKNYWETIDSSVKKGTDEEIRNRIRNKINNCGYFWPFKNNCEHLSNYLRYGKEFSDQGPSWSKNKLRSALNLNIMDDQHSPQTPS